MKIVLRLGLCFLLSSCAAQVHSNKVSYAQSERDKWRGPAEAGREEAQYRLGNAYCCGENGYFSTAKAVEWWCRAAAQGHQAAHQALIVHDAAAGCENSKN